MKEKKKIAIVLSDFSVLGGVEKVTSNLSCLLQNNDFDFFGVISLKNKYKTPRIKFPSEIKIDVVNFNDLLSFVKKNKIDTVIFQVQWLYTSSILIKSLKRMGVNVIAVLHNTPYAYLYWHFKINSVRNCLKFLRWFFYHKVFSKFLLRKITCFSDSFLMVSNTVVNEIKDILPSNLHHKISYIYNPLSEKSKPTSIIPKKENYIVYAGRFSEDKRVFETVKTLSSLLDEYPSWTFLILGDGPERNKIDNYLRERNIRNIKLLGVVNNVSDYLEKSKICLLYSKFEGLPTILLEAMSSYNALISYNSYGGAKDVVFNKENGFIVNSSNELYEKVEFLLKNDDCLEKMMLRNENFLEKFSQDSILSEWKKIL